MDKIIVLLLTIFSVQLVNAQKTRLDYDDYNEYLASLKIVKTGQNSYYVDKGPEIFAIWNVKCDLTSGTNVDDVSKLPKLTLVNKHLLDQFIEKNMPKQDKVDEIKENMFRLFLWSDNTGRKIETIFFSFDNKLNLPIETVDAIETFLKKNCYLEFEPTKITRNARYIQYFYFYYLDQHEFPK